MIFIDYLVWFDIFNYKIQHESNTPRLMEDKIQMLNAEQKRYTIQEMQELKVSKYLLNIDAVLNKLPKIQ